MLSRHTECIPETSGQVHRSLRDALIHKMTTVLENNAFCKSCFDRHSVADKCLGQVKRSDCALGMAALECGHKTSLNFETLTGQSCMSLLQMRSWL